MKIEEHKDFTAICIESITDLYTCKVELEKKDICVYKIASYFGTGSIIKNEHTISCNYKNKDKVIVISLGDWILISDIDVSIANNSEYEKFISSQIEETSNKLPYKLLTQEEENSIYSNLDRIENILAPRINSILDEDSYNIVLAHIVNIKNVLEL